MNKPDRPHVKTGGRVHGNENARVSVKLPGKNELLDVSPRQGAGDCIRIIRHDAEMLDLIDGKRFCFFLVQEDTAPFRAVPKVTQSKIVGY